MNLAKRLTATREELSQVKRAFLYYSENLVPSIFVFPALGILPWLLGYPVTGSMTVISGSMMWFGFRPEHRDVKSAVRMALYLALTSFVLEITLWRHH